MRNCHVNHLQIAAPDLTSARRAALLVEDGLRTATLPGEGSRLVIVRTLALGRIGRQAAPATVALQIERTLQARRLQAVHAAHPAAAGAEAVFFHDAVEARQLLALVAARGEAPAAWFWLRAVPEWQPGSSRQDAMRIALASAAKLAEGPSAVVAVVRAVIEEGRVGSLLAALQPQDGSALLALCGWPEPPAEQFATGTAHPSTQLPANSVLLATWVQQWGADDMRTLWLANVLSAIALPARLADSALSRRSRQWIATVVHASGTGDAFRTMPGMAPRPDRQNEESQEAPMTGAIQGEGFAAPRLESASQQPARARDEALPPSMHAGQDQPAKAEAVETQLTLPGTGLEWQTLPLAATQAAGIWFLLPVLARMGFASWLDENPAWIDADIPRRILASLCLQLGVPLGDAIWPELAVADAAGAPWPADVLAVDALVAAWCTEIETWCAEAVGLELAAVVLRRGWLHTTRTHVDVYFDLAELDVQIRRAGLDLDPGWVPWLGRVVAFFYEAGLAAAAAPSI